ncbi:MAG: uracil-DNA glycosylase [Verrucomicrobia bacterium]|nr:MAG: uracil-DNA glycosylase [Verrucomicrobiota bacterium]
MTTNRKKLAAAVGQLEGHLAWLKEEGVQKLAADPKILAAAPPVLSTGTVAKTDSKPWKKETPTFQPLEKSLVGGSSSSRVQARELELPPTTSTNPALAEIAQRVAACQKCVLGKTRTRTVPGQGNPQPEIMFVGEGPGEDEDRQGLAFVGRAGQLLTRMIIRMGLTRDEVFIGNIVKCRPPGNRAPLPDEMAACLPYLREQIAMLKPKVIVCLGATAVKGLLNNQLGITKLRGHWQKYEGVDVMPTFHPSFLLRGGGEDKARWWEVWEDLVAVLKKVGREPPPQKTSAG